MINLSSNTVKTTAPANTVIGTMELLDDTATNQVANWSLTSTSANYFATLGATLITLRTSIPVGFYAVKVRANAQHINLKEKARFIIQVS